MPPSDAILATLLYFKQWNVPITPAECLRFLPAVLNPATITQLETIIQTKPLSSAFTRHQGFFLLRSQFRDVIAGNIVCGEPSEALAKEGTMENELPKEFVVTKEEEESVWHRHSCYNATLTKWRIASRTLRWITWIPFLRMVAVTNTLPMGLAKPESDIDLLIVGAAGRLWLVRLLVTAVTQLLGKRRHGQLITDRLCLSFYLNDTHLNLKEFFDTPRDLHYAYMVGMTTTIFEARNSGTQKAFENANIWLSEYFPQHYWSDLIDLFRVSDTPLMARVREVGEWMLSGRLGVATESFAQWAQKKKIERHPKSRIHEQGQHYVMATDGVIKFHESRAREESRKQWIEECHRYDIAISE